MTNATQPQTIGQSAAAVPSRVYTGYYRHRNTPPLQLNFNFVGDLKAAKDRFRKHCEVMGYLYMQVTPMIMDLDKREKLRNSTETDQYVDD